MVQAGQTPKRQLPLTRKVARTLRVASLATQTKKFSRVALLCVVVLLGITTIIMVERPTICTMMATARTMATAVAITRLILVKATMAAPTMATAPALQAPPIATRGRPTSTTAVLPISGPCTHSLATRSSPTRSSPADVVAMATARIALWLVTFRVARAA